VMRSPERKVGSIDEPETAMVWRSAHTRRKIADRASGDTARVSVISGDKADRRRMVQELLDICLDLFDRNDGVSTMAFLDDLIHGRSDLDPIPDESRHLVQGDHLFRIPVHDHGVALDLHLEGAADSYETVCG
jgi:hypothetical protein